MRAMLASVLLLIGSLCFAQGFNPGERSLSGTPQFLPVEEAYQLEVAILDENRVRLYWQIAPDYYLYQHRFAFSLEDEQGPVEIDAIIPEGLAHNDEYFGEVQIFYNSADIALQLARPTGKATLTATSQGCADAGLCYPPYKQSFELDFAAGTATPVATATPAAQPAAPPAGVSTLLDAQNEATPDASGLPYMLLLAFLGGMILNLMPCVFPILSLKVLSMARSTDHDRHLHSWLYTAGVIASFVLVATLLFALQKAGHAIGWGFQLQSPGFVIALAYLFVAMGLSLSGVVQLGGGLMNAGSGLANRGGLTGSFFTGVLAVVVASPCTAPFMGAALGFAVSQPPLVGLLVFAALGAGMAAPLLLFGYSGAARKLMPKPGPWMETLKQFLAFPLYATALWLLWVAGRQTGINTMSVALAGALFLALGLWLWHHNWWRRALSLACLVLAVGLGSQRGLDANDSATEPLAGSRTMWSEHAVDELRRAGKPVFVDITADWCITCKANESAVLNTDEIQEAFARHGAAYLVADWTNQDARIAALLKEHGRTGIPLYLLYAADPATPPIILPQILTKTIVLDALASISGNQSTVAEEAGRNEAVSGL
jgi:thiol:disulfide interchange protein